MVRGLGPRSRFLRVCHAVPHAKLRLLIELLYELQQEDLNAIRGRPSQQARAADAAKASGGAGGAAGPAEEEEEELDEDMRGATMDGLDDYLERLYEEDVAEKVAGARRILGLAVQVRRPARAAAPTLLRHARVCTVQPANLRALAERSSLMGALARILREDWKKHAELILVIMQAGAGRGARSRCQCVYPITPRSPPPAPAADHVLLQPLHGLPRPAAREPRRRRVHEGAAAAGEVEVIAPPP